MTTFVDAVPVRLYSELDGPFLVELLEKKLTATAYDEIVNLVLRRRDNLLDYAAFTAIMTRQHAELRPVTMGLYAGVRVPVTPLEELLARTLVKWGRLTMACAKSVLQGPDTAAELETIATSTCLSVKCRTQLARLSAMARECGAEGALGPATKTVVMDAIASHAPGGSYLKTISGPASSKFYQQGMTYHVMNVLNRADVLGTEVLEDLPVESFRELLAALAECSVDGTGDNRDSWAVAHRRREQTALTNVAAALNVYGLQVQAYNNLVLPNLRK